MDYQKIDGALSAKLELGASETESIPVFLRTVEHLPENACNHLIGLGLNPTSGNTVFAVELSKQQIDVLSGQPWITSIRLARQARQFGLR